jgi:hypothetical protein
LQQWDWQIQEVVRWNDAYYSALEGSTLKSVSDEARSFSSPILEFIASWLFFPCFQGAGLMLLIITYDCMFTSAVPLLIESMVFCSSIDIDTRPEAKSIVHSWRRSGLQS